MKDDESKLNYITPSDAYRFCFLFLPIRAARRNTYRGLLLGYKRIAFQAIIALTS